MENTPVFVISFIFAESTLMAINCQEGPCEVIKLTTLSYCHRKDGFIHSFILNL